jgi:hypothetical protein
MATDPVLVREERPAAAVLLPALLAGLVAAVVGGIVWGLIVKWTDYEVGFVAWGIGFLVGIAVVAGSRGARGLVFQSLAVACALLGIAVGKYLSFVWVLQNAANEETGFPVDFGADDFPVFSRNTFDLFRDNLDTVFGWIDLLWVGLAVVTAWRTLQPEEPQPAHAVDKPAPDEPASS